EGLDNPETGLTYDETRNLLFKIGEFEVAMMLDGGSSSIVYYEGEIQNFKNEKTRNYIPVLLSVYNKNPVVKK
ncbi:MAG: phosphodiester glycosidase family protein, partial [Thermotogota bacterium]|nr:phosphodiester glycosidase family protein [Thermotogota bacterium]